MRKALLTGVVLHIVVALGAFATGDLDLDGGVIRAGLDLVIDYFECGLGIVLPALALFAAHRLRGPSVADEPLHDRTEQLSSR